MEKEAFLRSYERHAKYEEDSVLASCYSNPDCIDAWRHARMIGTVASLLRHYQGAKVLTIGDGMYGADAYLIKKLNLEAIASSLTDKYLMIAKERGYIDQYYAVNAENIPFEDNSFDFVFCKASYHHFPRPPIAFYEMLRVASVAVILIEPTDDRYYLIDFLKRSLKKLIRQGKNIDYEPSGNFIFRIKSKEIKKMLMAMDKPFMGVKYFNDIYIESIAGHNSNMRSPGFIATRFLIFIQDVLCYLRLLNYCHATIIAFKSQISPGVQNDLRKDGFRVSALSKNPYL
jgi:ubiquinone/menaquinone biosynthesis C-methylase UbiE